MREGSKWTFAHIEQLEIHLNEFNPLRGSYYIPTPLALAKKKAIVNVKNEDKYCFQWAVLAALNHDEVYGNHAYRLNQYKKWEGELKFDDIDFPVSLKATDKFERRNADLNINGFGYDGLKKGKDEVEDLQIYHFRISKNTGAQHVVF